MSLYGVLRPYLVPDAPLEPPEMPRPICPECGAECDTVYEDSRGDIFGCDRCVSIKNAWDVPELLEEE